MKFGANGLEVVEFQRTLNPKLHPPDSNLGPLCEGSGRTKDLPTLGPRVEARNETRNPPCGGGGEKGWEEFCDLEPCHNTNCGTSTNDLNNFSNKMSKIQNSCWDKWFTLSFS
ncbi:hypothetical protein AVEN_128394-1 [Araneus ventricosus]|uniref:Uncharacterized protein n=1 Tax=Araneus ventricosus TaxID=182803 RepID=A0A4Y2PVR9_ARAVE|nr:hypothetical protein AVEN_128394-1 [Araneus ventricosus]